MFSEIIDPAAFLSDLMVQDTLTIYRDALFLQTNLHQEQTRRVLEGSTVWQKARSVLDAGCGAGAFGLVFADLLAGKQYVGVDKEQQFIEWAQASLGQDARQLVCRDIYDFDGGSFDVIIAHALLQHLPDLQKAVAKLSEQLASGGVLFVSDNGGSEPENLVEPEIVPVCAMFDELSRLSAERGRTLDCIEQAKAAANACGLEVIYEVPCSTPVVDNMAKWHFVHFVLRVSVLIDRFYSIRPDRDAIMQGLLHWASLPQARATMRGGKWLLLQKLR